MLSILRFTIDEERVDDLLTIGNTIEAAEPNTVEPRKLRDGFTCTIEDSDFWAHHLKELTAFVTKHATPIRDAIALGARVTFDVAIDPEDQRAQKHALLLLARAPFLALLGGVGIDLELSIYRPQLATDEA